MLSISTKTLLRCCAVFALLLSACATEWVKPDRPYSRLASLPFYNLTEWSIDGRLAVSGKQESWSANLEWEHFSEQERIKLSGPLGQGATRIQLSNEQITIDKGNGDVHSSGQADAFIYQQLGVPVPVRSLRYWVLGLPEPEHDFDEAGSGFEQSGWLVEYQQMQSVDDRLMPRKITVTNDQVKLKLIIDQWVVNNTNAK